MALGPIEDLFEIVLVLGRRDLLSTQGRNFTRGDDSIVSAELKTSQSMDPCHSLVNDLKTNEVLIALGILTVSLTWRLLVTVVSALVLCS